MINYYLPLSCSKEECDQGGEDRIYGLPTKGEGELLTIEGNPTYEWYCMFE